jgi:multidrug efflux pump
MRTGATAILGGLLVAQFFTLYTTPAMYLVMDRLRRRGHDRRADGVRPATALSTS